jgi:thioredoxin reductase (NADPH)
MKVEDHTATPCDCLIVGGGPAGLTAAIYLARFHLKVIVIDAGGSRAAQIPMTRNHAGFPDGISGTDLLTRMRLQATKYGAELRLGTVDRLEQGLDGNLLATCDGSQVVAPTVLLATGVVNRRPAMIDGYTHDLALAGGQLRYCPICDGYEVTDRSVAVLGAGRRGFDEALFVRSYTADVTLIASEAPHDFTLEQRDALSAAGVKLAGRCSAIGLAGQRIALTLPEGTKEYDSLYPALGSDIQSGLARRLGAAMSEDGCLTVDPHQRTSVAGLYAAGDVVLGLDQISHAMGEGGVAATTMRNDLARKAPLLR